MKKISVLGPKGTYSDIACKKYLKDNKLNDYEIVYYNTIIKACNSNDDLKIVPFENTLDGFVMESLDTIINNNYHIIDEIKLPIDFSFVSNEKDIKDVSNVYVQFKAKGQCLEFLNDFNTLNTESNGQSLELIRNNKQKGFGAIVIPNEIKDNEFNIRIDHVADIKNNETRFVILSNENHPIIENDFLASIVITSTVDRPGILYDILTVFHDLNINMNSILSRPLKTLMGKYKFYIECSFKDNGYILLNDLLRKLSVNFKVDLIGIYKGC